MNIKDVFILNEAIDDLQDGKEFYNQQENGVGEYFWNCLVTDIEL